MSSVGIIACGAISSLGEGREAASAGEVGAPARVAIRRDDELARAGLARPFAARAWPMVPSGRAAGMLGRALSTCLVDLDRVRPLWRSERIGLIVGTSSGGMRAAETAFEEMDAGRPITDPDSSTYGGPLHAAVGELGLAFDPYVLVLGACASAVLSMGMATRWLERGDCDVVLAGGFDEVTVFVASGFEGLRATTAAPPPRPFRTERDGMSLGEGAAVVALAREPASQARAFIVGFGAASDAVHLTAPDRNGAGLARAAQAAVTEGGAGPIDLISAHATATPYNDAAESRAIATVLGAEGREIPLHPFKAQVGHTLGAAGALELLVCLDAMERKVLPAAAGEGTLDPDARVRLLAAAEHGEVRRALKLASAFGGSNAALVLSTQPGARARPRRPAFLHQAVRVADEGGIEELAARTGMAPERVERADRLVRLAWASIAALAAVCGPLAGAGLVIGTAMGPIETNADFAGRVRRGGVRAAEPRRFAYTSPNTAAGECSIAFGLSGPSFAVGGGMHAGLEALASAALLVESRDADRFVVVAVDDVGPATRAIAGDALLTGAVASLVSADGGTGARARIGGMSIRRGHTSHGVAPVTGAGHAALLALAEDVLPGEIVVVSPPDVVARVGLDF